MVWRTASVLLLVICFGVKADKSDGCPSDVFTTTSGIVTSPGWPGEYPDRWDCEWNITVPDGQYVHLQFTEFSLEPHASCFYDYLQITDYEDFWSSTEKFCGSTVPPLLISRSNSLTLRFVSDGSSTNSGFHAVYAAVRKPYNCEKNDIQAFVPKGETTVDVEIIPGTFVNLSPGFHTVWVPIFNCTSKVIVNTASSPVETCPNTVSTVANADTQMGVFSISAGGYLFELTLPRGGYNYHYKLNGNDCDTQFRVFDSRLRRRLDFSADYDIKCAALQFAGSNSALISVAEQKYPEIERLCKGRCKMSLTEKVQIKCQNDTTTITWPTTQVFSGDVEEVPAGFIDSSSSSGVRSKTILSVFLYTKVPRVVYPIVGTYGVTVQSHLIPFCTEQYIYDPVNEVCVSFK